MEYVEDKKIYRGMLENEFKPFERSSLRDYFNFLRTNLRFGIFHCVFYMGIPWNLNELNILLVFFCFMYNESDGIRGVYILDSKKFLKD